MTAAPESTGFRRRHPPFRWSTLLWALVFPHPRQRTAPTISGLVLMVLAFGVGTAAYNAANNILFITLSLLLACLVLSGVLSWLNFRGVFWQLELAPPLRVGQEATVALLLRNDKKILPSYGLWFDLVARAVEQGPPGRAETTLTARGIDVREAFAHADRMESRERLHLRSRLDPSGETRMEWSFQPVRRGRLRVELEGVGSLFPFGFLKKSFGTDLREEVVVWPAPVEYRRFAITALQRTAGGERVPRAGSGSDLLALRRYEPGDSHRLIHWKASARTRQLLVRQFSAESSDGFVLWVETEAAAWPRAEQFELLVSFAATLAEDLFRAGQLVGVALDAEAFAPIRRVRDLETWLDRLATTVPRKIAGPRPVGRAGPRNVITFAPDGPRGVTAVVAGERFATA